MTAPGKTRKNRVDEKFRMRLPIGMFDEKKGVVSCPAGEGDTKMRMAEGGRGHAAGVPVKDQCAATASSLGA
jgi:hypothetical protein